jgi:hypothetical protein
MIFGDLQGAICRWDIGGIRMSLPTNGCIATIGSASYWING